MGKTIGRKVLTMVGILGFLLLGIVLANLSALSIINGFNKEIESNITQYMDAAKQGNSEQMQEIEESLTSILYHNALRIEGTCTFDMVLVVAVVIAMVITVFIVIKTVSGPAKKANLHLNKIVEKMKENKGDLTARIPVRSKDEVGRLVSGINGFIENLQNVIKTIKINTKNLLDVSDNIVTQVSTSSESARNVSASTEELSANMQEISVSLDEIATESRDILEKVQLC